MFDRFATGWLREFPDARVVQAAGSLLVVRCLLGNNEQWLLLVVLTKFDRTAHQLGHGGVK